MNKLNCEHQILTLPPFVSQSHIKPARGLIVLVLDLAANGKNIALISEAGTPSISDTGYILVRHALDLHIKVIPVPGPTALIAALCASGLPTRSIIFEGFIPRKAGKRESLFLSLRDQPRTLIFYESPRRLVATLQSLLAMLGDRQIVIAREMSKVFEEMVRGSISEVITVSTD